MLRLHILLNELLNAKTAYSARRTLSSNVCFLLDEPQSTTIAYLTRWAIVFYSSTFYSTKIRVPQHHVPLDEIPFHHCMFSPRDIVSILRIPFYKIHFNNSLLYFTSCSVPQSAYSSRRVPLENSSVPFLQKCELGD